MKERAPSYDLRPASRADVLALFEANHGYKSLSNAMTYCFAVHEPRSGPSRRGDQVVESTTEIVAAYAWQPPPVGAAKAVCAEAPAGVLSLSRMVAVNRRDRDGAPLRSLKHVSKPLRRQMRSLIDRSRWPVLVTFSDEGEGHNGFVYRCSGWTPTTRETRPIYVDATGARRSSYSNGVHGARDLTRAGVTTIQRWENWICLRGQAHTWMASHGWTRVAIPGKTWASGNQAHKWIRLAAGRATDDKAILPVVEFAEGART